jgi:hypothetical protein
MKKICYLLLLFILVLISACKGSIGNSKVINDSPNSKKVMVENNTKESNSEEAQTEIEENPKKTQDLNSLIPLGWGVLNKGEPVITEGDLNKDGIKDIAAIIEQIMSVTEEAPLRSLFIAFGASDNTYSLSIIADNVILNADEGGVWGDPFKSLTIDRGSVVVSDYGGSNWRWYNQYRFRFQDNDWFLIGATMGDYFTGNATQEEANEQDYNLLTGDYIFMKSNEDGKITTERGNRGRRELVTLKDFNIENI